MTEHWYGHSLETNTFRFVPRFGHYKYIELTHLYEHNLCTLVYKTTVFEQKFTSPSEKQINIEKILFFISSQLSWTWWRKNNINNIFSIHN